ncbi:ABC transporter ATP-binding protein [Salarchaeum sp. JOR-1]|uniref:ABC transporter ATP-binding protein n=1 Tax=Salarchaeum sp. JOR-1 TaxID=2599399 RepID=UPI001198B0DA|nr:ABC transporter ATP-binding protein [Salarchaeum sp. JOR-1]QDX40464.1 ABC transporter ATP-binding protein [Salarchaeum sp. JOR-1]
MTLHFDVSARFSDADAAFDVAADLAVADGETLILLGPSGSGKTLLLELVAGFHDHDGIVELGGTDVTDRRPEDRGFGFVFQNYALFPHLTPRENVAFGTEYHDDARDPDDLLAQFGVSDLADRSVTTLSGGERQRVALARALAVRPNAFLLDEPLSALDAPTRDQLRAELLDVLDGETAVYVTHDRTTARALADRVAVIADGRVRQVGSVADVFDRPDSPFVARFTGANCVPPSIIPAARCETADADRVAFRPEHVTLGSGDATADVVRVVREDATHRVTLAVDGVEFDALTDHAPQNDTVTVGVPANRLHPVERT